MKKRPPEVSLFAAIYLLVAFSFPLQIMMIYQEDFWDAAGVLAKLNGLNLFCMAALLISVGPILLVSRLCRWFLPVTMLAIAVNNLAVAFVATEYSSEMAWLGTALFVSAHGLLLTPRTQALFARPSSRWWLRTPRAVVAVPAFVDPFDGLSLRTKTFDLNEKGAFLAIDEQDIRRGRLHVDDRMSICLTLGSFSQIRCEARVVRVAQPRSGSSYPHGIGIEFQNLPITQKWELRRYSRARNALPALN